MAIAVREPALDDAGGGGGTDSDQEGGAGIFGPVASLTVRTLGHACDIAHGGSILWRSALFGDDDATSESPETYAFDGCRIGCGN